MNKVDIELIKTVIVIIIKSHVPLKSEKNARAVVPYSLPLRDTKMKLGPFNIVKTPTQPNVTLSWVRHENDFAHHHPTPPHPPTQTQC